MADSPFTYDDAVTWIATHPFDRPTKFKAQALQLGPGVIPGMVQVLADAPIEHHTAAALVLSFYGVEVVGHGVAAEDFEYRLTFSDGDRQVVHPVNFTDADFAEVPRGEIGPTVDEEGLKRFFLQYLIMFVLAGALAYGASRSSGALSILLAVMAGLLFVLALWSTLFMSVIGLVLRTGKKVDED